VRFDVAHRGADRVGHPIQAGDLVGHLIAQLLGIDVQVPPPEAGQVAVAHVRAHPNTPLGGQRADPAHGAGIAGMEPAGNVGAGHNLEQRGVITHQPGTKALTEVGVQIDVARGDVGR